MGFDWYIKVKFYLICIVKRSGLFMTVLLSLFIFQGIWNIAAAFCLHENSVTLPSTPHFGHHVLTEQHKKSQHTQHPSMMQLEQYLGQMDQHSDHLAMVNYLHVASPEHALDQAQVFKLMQQVFWHPDDLYQSPDLNLLIPPPVYPLL